MKKILIWTLIPIFTFTTLEMGVRQWKYIYNSGYSKLQNINSKAKVDHLFIGSSRVASAINISEVKNILKQAGRKNVNPVNMGMGFSTLQEHYLGLRGFLRTNKEVGRNLTVFIEAPSGISDWDNNNDHWFREEQPQLLINVLAFSDLPLFWASNTSLNSKLSITVSMLMSWSKLYSFKARLRNGILVKGNSVFERFFQVDKRKKQVVDLSTAGNVRNDQDGVKRVREITIAQGKVKLKQQKAILGWKNSVLKKIIDLVKLHGGNTVIFEMPTSSVISNLYSTEIRKNDSKNFSNILKKWKIRYIKANMTFVDNDFPDLCHMSKTMSIPFTQKLISNYIREK